MMSRMFGSSKGGNGTRGASTNHIRNNSSNSNSSNSVFREEQTDLLDVFHDHQFDLLAGNPPSLNPDYDPRSELVNPPSYNPDFVPTYYNSDQYNGVSTTPSFGRNVGIAENSSPPVPLASAVEVSDTEEDSAIPFVAALRIDEEEEDEPIRPTTRSRPLGSGLAQAPNVVEAASVQPSCRPPPLVFSGATRARPEIPFVAERRTQEPASMPQSQWQPPMQEPAPMPQPPAGQRPPPLVFSPQSESSTVTFPDIAWLSDPDTAWLTQESPRSTESTASHRSGSRTRRSSSSSSCSGSHCTNWSRLSVHARAAAGEARRSFKKTLAKEKALWREESDRLKRSTKSALAREKALLREESDRLKRSTRKLANDQRAAMESLLPGRRKGR